MPCTAGRCLGCPLGQFSDDNLGDLSVIVVDRSARLIWWPPWLPFEGTAADLGGTRWLEWFETRDACRALRWIRDGCPGCFVFPARLHAIGGGIHTVRCCGERFQGETWVIGFDLRPSFEFPAPGRHPDMQR